MKRIFSSLLALCLIVALLPFAAVPVRAAGGPEGALQHILYFDAINRTVSDESTTGILVTDGQSNLVITIFPSRESEDIYTAFTTEKEDVDICSAVGEWGQYFTMYSADPSYGAADGFTKMGTVTEGETVYLVLGWDKEGQKGGASTTATAYQDGKISLKETPGTMSYPIPVINSKNEVCAIYYDDYCFSLITDEETFYGNSNAKETQPPVTESPETESPATEPAETESPETESPEPEPAETEPAETEPPVTEPPETEPPVTEPPVTESPATEPDPIAENMDDFGLPTDLPELDSLYAAAIVQKKSNQSGVIAVSVIAALIVILLAAVIIVRRRNKLKIHEDLNEAEEGTVLADVPADTGLRLQFRNGKRIAVKRSFTIGRAPENDVVIPRTSSAVSGRHCEIVVQNGAVYLRDLGSTNGTFINGKRMVPGQLVQLLPGMMIGLGNPNGQEAFAVVSSSK